MAGLGAAAVAGAAGWGLWRQRPDLVDEPPTVQLPPDPLFPNALKVPGEDGLHGILDAAGSFTIVSRPCSRRSSGQGSFRFSANRRPACRALVNPLCSCSGLNLRVRYECVSRRRACAWHGLIVDTHNDAIRLRRRAGETTTIP